MMIIIFTILIIIFSIKSRVYDDIETIKSVLFNKFNDISIKFEISSQKDYFFLFDSKNIIYDLSKFKTSYLENSITLTNQSIELIFNLSIYEKLDKMFNYYSNNILHSELIKVDIFFQHLKFYKAKQDFSFDLDYKINNGDIEIFFENMKNVNAFNYLLNEDKDKLYENKTFYDFMKIKIIENFIKGMRKILIIYPECDSLNFFNEIINNCKGDLLSISFYIDGKSYYRAIIDYFEYEDINKINDVIIYEKVNTKITLIYYTDEGDLDEEYPDEYEYKILKFENVTIDMNLKIKFGRLIDGDSYASYIFEHILATNYSLINCKKF